MTNTTQVSECAGSQRDIAIIPSGLCTFSLWPGRVLASVRFDSVWETFPIRRDAIATMQRLQHEGTWAPPLFRRSDDQFTDGS